MAHMEKYLPRTLHISLKGQDLAQLIQLILLAGDL